MNEVSWSSVTVLPAARPAAGASAAPAAPAMAIFRKSRRDLPLMLAHPFCRRAVVARPAVMLNHRIAFRTAPEGASRRLSRGDRDVVDQSGPAEMGGGEEARGSGEPQHRRQIGGIAQLEIIDREPAGAQLGDAALKGGGDGTGILR